MTGCTRKNIKLMKDAYMFYWPHASPCHAGPLSQLHESSKNQCQKCNCRQVFRPNWSLLAGAVQHLLGQPPQQRTESTKGLKWARSPKVLAGDAWACHGDEFKAMYVCVCYWNNIILDHVSLASSHQALQSFQQHWKAGNRAWERG